MMRFFGSAIAALAVAACASNVRADAQNHPQAQQPATRVATVCDLANWGRGMVGVRVRLRAEYFTDFRHGAFLSDPKCPAVRLQLGVRSAAADASLERFDKALGQHYDYYLGRKFKVDVTGRFEWEEANVLYKELPPDRQLRIPAHGEISLLKIWSFEKPNWHKSK